MNSGKNIRECNDSLVEDQLIFAFIFMQALVSYFYDFPLFSKISNGVMPIKEFCTVAGSGLFLPLGKNKLLCPMVL